jgi:Bacterial membrane protein YfhO
MAALAAPLPGLYLALLGLLLARALRRWWDPVPPRVWGVFGLVLLILFGPALFLGRVLLPADILPGLKPLEEKSKPPEGNVLQLDLVTQTIPWQAQVRRAVRAGHWPLWNDLAGAGMPLLADPQSQVLQPLVFLAMPLPLPQAVGVTAALRVLIALVFLFLLLRRQGLSEGASLFGSLAFGLGGFLLLWLSWPIGNSPALLPLVLYALVMTDERGARRDFLLLVMAAASLLAGGHPETILYVAAVGSLFAVSRLLRRPAGQRARLLARWGLAGGIAFGLAAPAVLPVVRFLPQTHRGHLVELRNARLEKGPPLPGWRSPEERRQSLGGIGKRLVPIVAPNAFGNSRWGVYWGEVNTNEDATGFVGEAALLAALLALLPAGRRFPQERFFLILGAVSLAVAARIPGVPWLLAELPVLNQSASVHHRLLLVVAFSLAYAAACSVERWRRGEGPGRGAIAATAAVLLGLIAWGYLLPPEVETPFPLRWFWMALQLAAVAGTALVLLFSQSPSSPGRVGVRPGEEGRGGEGFGGESGRGARSSWILTTLLAVELLIIHRPANPSLPRREFYPTTPAIGFLQQHADGFRVAGLVDRLLPNSAAVYGLADIRISNPFKPFAYVQALAPITVSIRSTEHRLVKKEHPLLQLLGVRYIVAPLKLKPASGWRPVFRDPGTKIFERMAVLPRLFLPGAAEATGALPWPRWLAANPDFAARSLVLPSSGHATAWVAAKPAESAVENLSIEPARIAARVRLAEDRLLASSVYQDGGWTLLIDGRTTPAVLANGPFAAAWLPAGDHRVNLVYRAPGLVPGLALAAVALAALALGILTPRTRR